MDGKCVSDAVLNSSAIMDALRGHDAEALANAAQCELDRLGNIYVDLVRKKDKVTKMMQQLTEFMTTPRDRDEWIDTRDACMAAMREKQDAVFNMAEERKRQSYWIVKSAESNENVYLSGSSKILGTVIAGTLRDAYEEAQKKWAHLKTAKFIVLPIKDASPWEKDVAYYEDAWHAVI
jgi:hypothetical protein